MEKKKDIKQNKIKYIKNLLGIENDDINEEEENNTLVNQDNKNLKNNTKLNIKSNINNIENDEIEPNFSKERIDCESNIIINELLNESNFEDLEDSKNVDENMKSNVDNEYDYEDFTLGEPINDNFLIDKNEYGFLTVRSLPCPQTTREKK